jgi:uncharacterized protein YndB with AHSA1/START domain
MSRRLLHACPTDVVRAPAARIWRLVTAPEELARWSESRILDAPRRSLDTGDRLVLGAGVGHWLRVVFEVQAATAPRHLVLRIRLPFGVVNDEVIEIVAIDDVSSRVTFN